MTKLIFLFIFVYSYAETKDLSLTGIISAQKGCKGEGQIWLSQNRKLLFQQDTKFGSSFEFYLKPGSYKITVTSKDGCHAQQKLKLTDKSKYIKLNLTQL